MGLYANLADYRVRVAVIRVRISAAPLKSSVYSSGFKTRDKTSSRKPENVGSGFVFKDFLSSIEDASRTVSKWQLEAAQSVMVKAYAQRFKRRKEPRYGSINKGFTTPELQRFFRSIASEKLALLFKYHAYMGLRVGKVCQLHISNINFDKRELTIKSEKSGHTDSLIIPLDLFKETVEFMNKHQKEIKAAEGYIFYKENDNGHTGLPYINLNYVRNVFREVVQ